MTQSHDASLRRLYVDTVKRAVTNYLYLGHEAPFEAFTTTSMHYDVARSVWKIDPLARPLTLLTSQQLDLIDELVTDLEARQVPGDFIEAGIWRGGVVLFLRALIAGYGIAERKVFGADSFEGIPQNTRFKHDPVDSWRDRWVASFAEVTQAIARFGWLDDRTVLVPGYFADSLPRLAAERFALIRLDSDAFDSVAVSLDWLYPRLSKGGVIIIDDWHLVPAKMAVGLYRDRHGIADPVIVRADNAYWIKEQEYGYPMTQAANDIEVSASVHNAG